MPGPAPKPIDQRQRRGRNDLGAVAKVANCPPPPPRICADAKVAWAAYWSDVVAGVVRASDTSLVQRWAANMDRYHRIIRMADANPVVEGSTGQQKANGLYDLALKIEASIKADEQQMGIGPLNRLRLGVKLTEGAKSLSDLTAEVDGDDGDDPRLTLIS